LRFLFRPMVPSLSAWVGPAPTQQGPFAAWQGQVPPFLPRRIGPTVSLGKPFPQCHYYRARVPLVNQAMGMWERERLDEARMGLRCLVYLPLGRGGTGYGIWLVGLAPKCPGVVPTSVWQQSELFSGTICLRGRFALRLTCSHPTKSADSELVGTASAEEKHGGPRSAPRGECCACPGLWV